MRFLISSLPIATRRRMFYGDFRPVEGMRYSELWLSLMDLHRRQEMEEREAARAEAERLNCTWYQAHGMERAGHVWTTCVKLREFNREGASKRRGRNERTGRKERRRREGLRSGVDWL